jgi:hypothetical protein
MPRKKKGRPTYGNKKKERGPYLHRKRPHTDNKKINYK